jgi:hypothetical protein
MGKEKTLHTEGLARGVSSQEEVTILLLDKTFFFPSGHEYECCTTCSGNPHKICYHLTNEVDLVPRFFCQDGTVEHDM